MTEPLDIIDLTSSPTKPSHVQALTLPTTTPSQPSPKVTFTSSPKRTLPLAEESPAKRPVHKPETSTPPRPLKRYYLDSFRTSLDTVLETEHHLLSEVELTHCAVFNSLSEYAQYLWVRLFSRKHGWVRQNALAYPEIPCLVDTVQVLLQCDPPFIESGYDHLTSLPDLLTLLTLEELRVLCKPLGPVSKSTGPRTPSSTRSGQDKASLIARYLHYSRSQPTLHFFTQSKLSFGTKDGDQADPWQRRVWKVIGPVVQLASEGIQTFQRIQFIYHRSPPIGDQDTRTVEIMSAIKRWNYPEYPVTRSADLFPDRAAFLKFERFSYLYQELHDSSELEKHNPEALERLWALCEQCVEPWEESLKFELEAIESSDPKSSLSKVNRHYRRRFTVGYLCTRILHLGTTILANLKRYSEEASLLRKLLDQKVYSVGRRGKWYERLALVEMNYFTPKGQPKTAAYARSRTTCLEALRDPTVHPAILHKIVKRLDRLETGLGLEEKTRCRIPSLIRQEAPIVTITGTRMSTTSNRTASVASPSFSRPLYQSRDDQIISVEALSLEHYETQGYLGYHAENSLYTMLFALLFWDILFTPMPGVFETPFQTAPLDLNTDAFYPDRQSVILDHLTVIEKDFEGILKKVDKRERPRATQCIGVDWNIAQDDLLAMARGIGGKALAGICHTLARDYRHNRSGLPDLCLWHPENGNFRAVEVKGPGDTLSETQRIWIDTLMTLGVDVEVCRVELAKDV
ncbi:hypothetical protein IWQ62_002091 [Dispira parvispora]|uniref:Fanconi-associated nuclease n=1 Tax=Dispira parvispora TaxID=1520584 RepID=A0A9W8AS40_9FUNG|nr:hypothetical protein IWQ62_002091 [Dispira parvispora]